MTDSSAQPLGAPAELLRTEGLSKHYPGVDALVDVDFDLRAGEVHVLFGENGAGKSTLIGVLSGAVPPTRGAVFFRGRPIAANGVHAARRLGISAVFQEFSLVPQLSVEQNLCLGGEPTRGGLLDKAAMRREARDLLERLGFPLRPERLVLELSRAEQQMVEIAKAFRTELQVLILDEPTASLTERETERLFELIAQAKAAGVGIVYITHRTAEIRRIADRVTVLRDGRRIATVQAAEVGDDALIEMMAGRPIAQIFPSVRAAPGELLLEVDGLRTADGSVRGVSLTVRRGEIVGLAGLVGSGKSEIARACFGLLPVAQGRVRFKGADVTGLTARDMLARGFFYVPPDRRDEGLVLIRDTVENVSLPALGEAGFSAGWWLRRRGGRERVAALARRLNLQPFDLGRDVGHFSGGNQQKVLLAKALSREVELFVFDEPTVGVDVGTRAEIYRFIGELCEAGAGILLISSDLPEILHLAHRAYVLFRGRLQAELAGDAITEDEVLRHFFDRAA